MEPWEAVRSQLIPGNVRAEAGSSHEHDGGDPLLPPRSLTGGTDRASSLQRTSHPPCVLGGWYAEGRVASEARQRWR